MQSWEANLSPFCPYIKGSLETKNQPILRKLGHRGEDSTLLEPLGEQIMEGSPEIFGAESYNVDHPTIHGSKIGPLLMLKVL